MAKKKAKRRTVYDDLQKLKHDEDFLPPPMDQLSPVEFPSCPHPAGSNEKIEVMRWRVERGLPIFHPSDNPDRIPPTEAERRLALIARIRTVSLSAVFSRRKPVQK